MKRRAKQQGEARSSSRHLTAASLARIVVGIFALGALGVAAEQYVGAQRYYPTIRLVTPDGYSYSVVQNALPSRQACGEANRRFLEPIDRMCETCEVAYARCERELKGFELALANQQPLDKYVVSGGPIRVGIDGPARNLKAICEAIATAIVAHGVSSTACTYPPPH